MIKALVSSLKRVLRNPALLLPALAAIAILLVFAYALAPFLLDLLLNAVFLEAVPDAPLYEIPFQFFALYPLNLVALAVLALIGGILSVSLNYWYAAYARMSFEGNASIAKACSETVSAMGKIAAFTLFVALIALFFGVLLWAFAMVLATVQLLGLALLALLALAGFYLYIKLVFTVQALALEQGTVKQALQQSWEFALGKFWHVFLFVLIIAVISQAITFVGSYASDLVLDDVLSIVVLAVFWSISLAFAGIAMPFYYAEKKLGKSI